MRYANRLIAGVIIISCFIATAPVSVRAADGLTVSPPLREITLGPGLLEATTDVSLQNNTYQQIVAHLQLIDLKALGEYGGTSLDKAGLTDRYDLANWMTLPGGDTVVIASGETVKVRVNINNRDDLAPGGHYGAVVVTTSADNSVKSNVNISQQLLSLLFVKKLGGEVYGLKLESLQQKGSDVPQEVTTRFRSTGNVHVIPRGYIEVTDPAGKLVAKGIINEDSSSILPGGSRQYVTLMQPVAGANKAGQYKLTAYYRYDGQNEFSSQSIYFTHGSKYVPMVIRGVLALVFLATGILLVRRRKNVRRSA